jgi:ABC-type antimicrobial peptide transport system permease subunit
MQSLKTSLRGLWAAPAHAAGMISSLTVGLTLSLLAWVVATGLIYGDLPGLHERHRIARLHLQHNGAASTETVSGRQVGSGAWTRADVQLLETTKPSAFVTTAAEGVAVDSVRIGQSALRVSVAHAAGDYFETFGTTPALGRLLTRVDEAQVAVLGDGLWRAIGEPADVIGRTITIGARAYSVVGVAPANFGGLRVKDVGDGLLAGPQVWIPLESDIPLQAFGRLAPGVFAADLTTRLASLASTIEAVGTQPRSGLQIVGQTFGLDPYERPAVAVAAVALFMLLPLGILGLAIVNVINLQLARLVESERAIRIRLALGGTPTQATRWLAIEVLMISAASAAAALLLVSALMPYAQTIAPFVAPIGVSTFAAAAALTLLVAIVGGWWPAWVSARRAATSGPRATIPTTTRFRRSLVVTQTAAALALVFLTSLSVRSIQIATGGFGDGVDRLVVVSVENPSVELAEALAADPSMASAGVASFIPRTGRVRYWSGAARSGTGFTVDGGQVSSGWFAALGVTVLAGQLPHADSDGVVISDGLAQRLGAAPQDALGQPIRVGTSDADVSSATLVTVAAVVRLPYEMPGGQLPVAIFRVSRGPWPASTTLLARGRTAAPDMQLVREVLGTGAAAAGTVQVTPMRSVLEGGLVDVRLLANTFSALGGSALLLAASGLLALLLVGVRARRREFAVRAALGASGRALSGVVIREVMSLLAWGAVVGSVVGVAGASALRSQVANTSTVDPWAIALTAVTMSLMAGVATVLPAWNASRVPPADALKQ